MADDKFRIRNKQNGWITDPITQAQAEKIAGYPSEYEKGRDPKPVVVHDEEPRASKTTTTRKPAARRTATTATPTPTAATATINPTSAAAASDTASKS